MGHSFTCCYVHYVFSTKNRVKLIDEKIEERLWSYIGGIARRNNMQTLCVGGTSNHIHILLALPSAITIAKAIQLIKGGSSKWLNQTMVPESRRFDWQEGYGAFSVSISHLEKAIAYINNQKEHHRTKTFQEELLDFLDKHNIAYDERFIWK